MKIEAETRTGRDTKVEAHNRIATQCLTIVNAMRVSCRMTSAGVLEMETPPIMAYIAIAGNVHIAWVTMTTGDGDRPLYSVLAAMDIHGVSATVDEFGDIGNDYVMNDHCGLPRWLTPSSTAVNVRSSPTIGMDGEYVRLCASSRTGLVHFAMRKDGRI